MIPVTEPPRARFARNPISFCQALRYQENIGSVHELPAGVSVTAGRPRAPGLPAVAYRSQAFGRSVGIMPWSCHFASSGIFWGHPRGSEEDIAVFYPVPRAHKARPAGQAAPICHAGLERIGPSAGDLGPVTACPAGAARSPGPRPGWALLQGLLQGLGRRRVRAAVGPPRPVRRGTCRGSIRSTAGTSAPTAPSHRLDRRAASTGRIPGHGSTGACRGPGYGRRWCECWKSARKHAGISAASFRSAAAPR